MSTLPYPVKDAVSQMVKDAAERPMKDLQNLQAVADQIENLYSVDHTRMLKAVAIVRAQGIKKLSNGNFQVPSDTDANHSYQVNLDEPRCGCMDWAKRKSKDLDATPCKHLSAVLIWHTLPDSKITSPEFEAMKSYLFDPFKNKVKVTA